MTHIAKRRLVIFSIMGLIAATHVLRIGSFLQGAWFNLYHGYFSDVVIPFGGYFLLCAAEQQWAFLTPWKVKTAVAFLIPAAAEICQFFGLPVLGATFDTLDFLMYALGVALAVVFDQLIFSRLFKFWSLETGKK